MKNKIKLFIILFFCAAHTVRSQVFDQNNKTDTIQNNGSPVAGIIVNKSDNAAMSDSIQNDTVLSRVALAAGDVVTVSSQVIFTDASNAQTVAPHLFINREL